MCLQESCFRNVPAVPTLMTPDQKFNFITFSLEPVVQKPISLILGYHKINKIPNNFFMNLGILQSSEILSRSRRVFLPEVSK